MVHACFGLLSGVSSTLEDVGVKGLFSTMSQRSTSWD